MKIGKNTFFLPAFIVKYGYLFTIKIVCFFTRNVMPQKAGRNGEIYEITKY